MEQIELKIRDFNEEVIWSDTGIRMAGSLALDRGEVCVRQTFAQHCKDLEVLVQRACLYDPSYQPPDFSRFFSLICQDSPGFIKDLLLSPLIEFVQLVPDQHPELVVSLLPEAQNRENEQWHLDPSPVGIDARFAWGIEGGDGRGVVFGMIDTAWDQEHGDFKGLNIKTLPGGIPIGKAGHGTAALGIVAATLDGKGVAGIAHDLDAILLAPVKRELESGLKLNSVALAILSSLLCLRFGDVLLLEREWGSKKKALPIEVVPSAFEMIRLATALGVTVVEPAGNGCNDIGESFLIPDSGAVMVGAVGALQSHSYAVLSGTNYGKRLDCYAAGEDVITAGSVLTIKRPDMLVSSYDDSRITAKFDTTSSASAIIAGAVASIQGISRRWLGGPLPPGSLRKVLRNRENGTLVYQGKEVVGIVPNLKKIIEDMLRVSPASVCNFETVLDESGE